MNEQIKLQPDEIAAELLNIVALFAVLKSGKDPMMHKQIMDDVGNNVSKLIDYCEAELKLPTADFLMAAMMLVSTILTAGKLLAAIGKDEIMTKNHERGTENVTKH